MRQLPPLAGGGGVCGHKSSVKENRLLLKHRKSGAERSRDPLIFRRSHI